MSRRTVHNPAPLGPLDSFDFAASWATFATGEHQDELGGVKMWKLVDDLERYRQAIKAAQPQLVIEVGTRWGGSALWFAHRGVDVLTIDIDQTDSAESRRRTADYPEWSRVAFHQGDSLAPSTYARACDLAADYDRVMVSLDGEHRAPHVLAEIALYRELVTVDSYLVVEDGIFDLAPPEHAHLGGALIPTQGGPLRAIDALMPYDGRFKRDTGVEGMSPRTYHPAGWWQRVDQ